MCRLRLARIVGALFAFVALVATAAVAGPAATAEAAAGDQTLRVVTFNVKFGLGAAKVKQDLRKRVLPKADVVLVQEAKNVKIADLVPTDTFAVRQVVDAKKNPKAKQGSAVVIRRSVLAKNGIRDFRLVKGVGGVASCDGKDGMLDRHLAVARVELKNGTVVRLVSAHLPPKRCQQGPLYDSMIQSIAREVNKAPRRTIVGADWNQRVQANPGNIMGRTNHNFKLRGPALMKTEKSIDGFLIPKGLPASKAVRLQKGHSDHRPVLTRVVVPAQSGVVPGT